MNMSFKEKSTWISLVCTLWIFGVYFYKLSFLSGLPVVEANNATTSLFTQSLIYIIVAEIAFQGLLAAANRQDAQLGNDERDQLFSLKSNRVGYSLLVISVVITLGRLVYLEHPFADEYANSSLQIPMLSAHILLGGFLLSEIGRFAALLFFYRRDNI